MRKSISLLVFKSQSDMANRFGEEVAGTASSLGELQALLDHPSRIAGCWNLFLRDDGMDVTYADAWDYLDPRAKETAAVQTEADE